MKNVSLVCSKCGAKLEKSTEDDVYVCSHCGNKQLMLNDQSVGSVYVNNITKNIYGKDDDADEKYVRHIKNAESWIKVKEYKNAVDELKQATSLDVGNYLAWWLLAKTKILSNQERARSISIITTYSEASIMQDYEKALKFADDETKRAIKEEYKLLTKGMYPFKETNKSCSVVNEEMDKKINLQLSVLVILSVFILIFMVYAFSTEEIGFGVYVFVLFVCIMAGFLYSIKKLKVGKIIIFFVGGKEHVSLDEIVLYLKSNNKEESRDKVRKIINMLLEEEYLVGYVFEGDILKKVDELSDNNEN